MKRRQFNSTLLLTASATLACAPVTVRAAAPTGLANQDAVAGLRAVLERGASQAIQQLGRPDGFLSNPKVRIPLPGFLDDASKLLRGLGQGQRVDELVTAMNRAAEAAVPLARDLLTQAIRGLNVQDAAKILTGGETSVTEFFSSRTREPLSGQFLPVVSSATEKVKLTERYQKVAAKAASIGLLKKEDADLNQYVTAKTLDGLYFWIGEEEKKIRSDPVSAGSAILRKVFGALR